MNKKFTEEIFRKLLDMVFPRGYVERTCKYGSPSEEVWLDKRYLGWFCADKETDWVFPLVVLPDYEGAGIEFSWYNPQNIDSLLVQRLKETVEKFDSTLKPLNEDKTGL